MGSILASAPPELYNLLPFFLSPILGNPLSMAAHTVVASDPLPQQAQALALVRRHIMR